jgi:hypothetical protein
MASLQSLLLYFLLQKVAVCATNMYLLCMGLGFGSGLSVLYITMSAEQFGTNLRATAAISIPNMVRGFLPLIILLFQYLRNNVIVGENSYVTAAWITGIVVLAVGFISALYTKETFGKDLNFVEQLISFSLMNKRNFIKNISIYGNGNTCCRPARKIDRTVMNIFHLPALAEDGKVLGRCKRWL